MLRKITIKSNRIQEELGLEDGIYLAQIFPEKCKTIKEWQQNLFACIDDYCMATGNNRYVTWDEFKAENGVITTKDIPLEEFPRLLENLKFYLLSIS